MFKKKELSQAIRLTMTVALGSTLLTACNSDSDTAPVKVAENYKLQLLHVADMDGSNSRVLDNAGNFARNLDALTKQYPENTLFVSSGDNYIPGSRYAASDDDVFANVAGVNVPGVGRGDIAMLNAMGVKASAVGNHDMDGGPEEFATIFGADNAYPGAQFPYLSANLDFSADANTAPHVTEAGQLVSEVANKLAASSIVEVNGQRIALIGATTPTQDVITSVGNVTVLPANNEIADLAAIIQQEVDAVVATGIDKVVLLAHMQNINVEKQLATLLKDVDIIVAGGSNTLLATTEDELWPGDTAADTYPILLKSASDQPVAVVNVEGDYKYLGRLIVEFDKDGVLVEDSIDSAVSGPVLSTQARADELGGEANADVEAVVTAMKDVLVASESVILGHSNVFLNGIRAHVRGQESNLGNLTADANLWYAQQHDANTVISIKNGGGIRAEIGQSYFPAGSTNPEDITYEQTAAFPAANKAQGDISKYDIQTALSFNNDLVLMDVTATELKAIIEHAIGEVDATDASGYGGGRFPQIGGMSFSFDATQAARAVDGTSGAVTVAGERVRSLTVGNDVVIADGAIQGDANRTFKLVTLGYIGRGGDGYPFPCAGTDCADNQVRLETAMTNDPALSDFSATGKEQDALAEYLKAVHPDAANAYNGSDDLISVTHTDTRIVPLH
ncbi:bifunctional metallophosphatase/5'-nucleotidase [Thaumasiovibrio subtropicus]|uniref:bifunctional metallophosphatase/5'-nucleotidase n=1 Tax=Thaumasiovibrio subtropicus TaxID=1891207 RepID=UPI00131BF532|nr:5'-nucleotidase C-terminal domain-containing protein [Thaumasiovibrio subtropicus]